MGHNDILRLPQVCERVGLKRSAVYAKLRLNPSRPNEYDPSFPPPVRLGVRSVGWFAADIDGWLATRPSTGGGR